MCKRKEIGGESCKTRRSGKNKKTSNDLLGSMFEGVKTQDNLWGKDGLITKLNKALIEQMLNAEMDYHFDDKFTGRTFEPQIIPKRTTRLESFDNAILSLYTRDMIVRDIQRWL